MFKVDILKDARNAEEQAGAFVEQTKQLLLSEGTRERQLLSAAGLDKQSVEAVRLRDEKAMREELKMKTGATAVLTEAEIRSLCIKYRLRLLPSRRYAGHIDALTGRRMAKFLDDIGDPSPAHSARERFYVMAPAEMFTLDLAKRPVDPVLFYRHDSGVFAVVHKWGNDFTVFRRIIGALTADALTWRWFMFLSMLLVTAGGLALLLANGHGGAALVYGFVMAVLTGVRTTGAVDQGMHKAEATFSDRAWNSDRFTKTSLFWM